MTPTDSAEKVVAELRLRDLAGVNPDGTPLHPSVREEIRRSIATIERVERERDEAWGQAHLGHSRAEAAEARVTALEAEKGGFQWFGIESAPKSGDILVCGCSYGPAVRIAHWGNGRFLGRKKGYEQGWSHVPGHTCDPKFWAPIPMAQALSRSSTEVKNDDL